MSRQRQPAPLIPDDIKARKRREAEQAREKHKRAMEAQQDRDRLVAAGNRVEALGGDYELEQRTDRLLQWIAAMAAYKALLPSWPNPNVAPAGAIGYDTGAWQPSARIFLAADTHPDRAAAELAELAADNPGFAMSMARWLRQGMRAVCVGWLDRKAFNANDV